MVFNICKEEKTDQLLSANFFVCENDELGQWSQMESFYRKSLMQLYKWGPIVTQHTASSPRNAQLSQLELDVVFCLYEKQMWQSQDID